MKNILAILGSPRKGGNSETLLEAVLDGARGENKAMIEVIRLQGMNLLECLDCRKCWSKDSPCATADDMVKIHEKIKLADIVVFASPLYWYTWSSQIKRVWDRFLPFIDEKAKWNLKGKKAVLIATAGDNKAEAFEGLVFSFRTSCDLLGMDHSKQLLAHGVYKMGEASKGDWLSKAEELGRSLLR